MDTPTTSLETLVTTLKQRLEGTPYTVTRTTEGFDVAIDLANTKWWLPLSRNGLKDSFAFEVKAEEATKNVSITDTKRRIEWTAGVNPGELKPFFNLNYSYASGRIIGVHKEIQLGMSDNGAIGKVVDIDFSPSPIRKVIRSVATQQGWKESMGRNQKIGLYFALGAGVLVVGILIAMFISLSMK